MSSTPAKTAARAWDVHGVPITIAADDPAVTAAVAARFAAFPAAPDGEPPNNAIKIAFVAPGDGPPSPPIIGGRPVYETRHGTLYYSAGADRLHGRFGAVELSCCAGTGTARITCRAFTGRALYIATHPLLTVALMELLERRGRFALHAAALCDDAGRGVLLAGTSGAGKSTLALALARSGLGFLADDTIFLGEQGGSFSVLGFADTVGITPFTAEVFPELAARLTAPPHDGFPKRLHRIEDLFGRPPATSCAPRVLVFPTVAGVPASTLTPMAPGEALLRLTPDVLLTDSAASQAHLAAIARLLAAVDCYTLAVGTDVAQAALTVTGLLA